MAIGLNASCGANKHDGTCISGSFFVVLLYIDFIIFTVFNTYAFKVQDLKQWGKETLPHPMTRKYEDRINFDKVHDLMSIDACWVSNFYI